MGPNSPQKFSAAKLFGFGGGDSKNVPDPPAPKPAPPPAAEEAGSFANSFSTQAIKVVFRYLLNIYNISTHYLCQGH